MLLHKKAEIETKNFLPQKDKTTILLTCGASCPDSVVESILEKMLSFFPETGNIDEQIEGQLK